MAWGAPRQRRKQTSQADKRRFDFRMSLGPVAKQNMDDPCRLRESLPGGAFLPLSAIGGWAHYATQTPVKQGISAREGNALSAFRQTRDRSLQRSRDLNLRRCRFDGSTLGW